MVHVMDSTLGSTSGDVIVLRHRVPHTCFSLDSASGISNVDIVYDTWIHCLRTPSIFYGVYCTCLYDNTESLISRLVKMSTEIRDEGPLIAWYPILESPGESANV